MEFRILGSLEVVDGDAVVSLPSGKAKLLLAALLVDAGRVVSTDRLYEVLWGEQPPETAANTLQTYVNHLRNALEPGRARRQPSRFVVMKGPGYVLTAEPEQIDARRFERLVGDGRRRLHDPGEAAATLRRALELWRGDAMADFSFETFAQAEITRLTELRLGAVEDRIQADLALGGHAQLCGELAQLVAQHPLREQLWGHLMVALYRCGRQAEALRAFAQLRDTLGHQLGILPSPALTRLEEAMLLQKPELDWPPAAPIPSTGAFGGAIDVDPPAASLGDGDLADPRPAARDALQRRDWQRAFDLLSAADTGALDGAGLEGLAEAALWLGRPRESLAARQRAHAAFVDEGNPRRAALVAVVLSLHHAARVHLSVAGGWFHRAQRLLEEEPEGPEHGFLAWAASMFAIATGDHAAAVDQARTAHEIGCRFGVPDLQALGLVFQGYVLVRRGQLSEGQALMDEGMTWAVGGDLAPLPSALIFCRTIGTCYELGDYRRATEWMEAVAECFERTGIGMLPGDCDAHRVGILVGSGAWSAGELEARRACARIERVDLAHVGLAFHEIGGIRLRLGDLDGAETAFRRAAEMGTVPQPGLALLQLARGHVAEATAAIAAALAETWDRLARARLLAAQVEIALAGDDAETARVAVSELDEVASVYPSPALAAAAVCSRAAVQLDDGDVEGAVRLLHHGLQLWRDASAPYDAAKARLLLARALSLAGDTRTAMGEARAARSSFESLGARLDADRAITLEAELEASLSTR